MNAQPAGDSKSDLMTDRARTLHKEGDDLYAKGDIPRARVAYIAAWNLKKHWQLAASLGDCEMKLSLYRDAAEHLTFMTRNYPVDGDKARLDSAKALLAKARSQVGAVHVTSTVSGADVSIDGAVVGQTPLADTLFFAPGAHDIELKKLGYRPNKTQLDARAGVEQSIAITLQPEDGAGSHDNTNNGGSLVPPVNPPLQPKRSKLPGALLTGAGVVGVGVGIGLIVVATGKNSDAKTEGKGLSCGAGRTDAGCSHLQKTVSSRNAFMAGGGASLGVGLGLATAGIAYLLWPESRVVVSPAVGPTSNGLLVGGSF